MAKLAEVLDDAVRDMDIARHQADVDAKYPGLREAAISQAKRLERTGPPGSAPRKLELVAVVLADRQPDMSRYLNYWARADLTRRLPQRHYPAKTFDQVSSVIPAGSAYVIVRDGAEKMVFHFGQVENGRWMPLSFGNLAGAMRLGAMMALIEDSMRTARDGKDLALFVANDGVKWPLEKPASWVIFEQMWENDGMGLYPLQDRLGSLDKRGAKIGIAVREADARTVGVEMRLTSTPAIEQYLGWRIERIDKSARPKTEPAD